MVSGRDCFHSRTDTTIIATTEKLISIAVFQCEGESANRLKAAPVFSVCVMRKKPRDDLDVVVHRDMRGDETLRPAVEQHDEECKKKMYGARGIFIHQSSGRFQPSAKPNDLFAKSSAIFAV